jgi:MarR family 2-MHQ and catechol resistance regulon transcriptional repressor
MAAKQDAPEPVHVWLVVMKAARAIAKYAASGIQNTGLGESDFRVLEALLHKGPMSVNAIGPKVDLNPGAISVAVDRLYSRGLVSRVEDGRDRRVRMVALTPSGRELIVRVFRQHAAVMREVFAEVKPDELGSLEAVLKKVGKRAEALAATPPPTGNAVGRRRIGRTRAQTIRPASADVHPTIASRRPTRV